MKRLIVTVIVVSVAAFVFCDDYCTGTYFRNQEYFEFDSIIKEGISNLRSLTIARPRNELYFTYSCWDEDVKSKTAFITLEDEQFHNIDVNNTNTNAFDETNNLVYIGAIDGLYKVDNEDKIEKTNVTENVISIILRDNEVNYVNSFNEVKFLKDGVTGSVKELEGVKVLRGAVNKRGTIVFINIDHKVGFVTAEGVKLLDFEGLSVTVDQRDVIYVCAKNGLYEFANTDLRKVADLNNLQGIVFVNENEPIYAFVGIIVRLKRNEIPCM